MMFNLRNEPGWIGAFTREQTPDALANATRVRKVRSEPGDGHPDGALGTVLGSISDPCVRDGVPMYFIEWDTRPRVAVGTVGWKVVAA